MSLINDKELPIPDSIKNKQKERQVRRIARRIFLANKENYEMMFNLVFSGTKEQSQAILDELGIEAKTFFLFSNKLVQMLKEANPNYQGPEIPYNFTINPDGTVTLGSLK